MFVKHVKITSSFFQVLNELRKRNPSLAPNFSKLKKVITKLVYFNVVLIFGHGWLHGNQFSKTFQNWFLSKLAMFVLHDGLCGSFHNKATIDASALLCVGYYDKNLDEDSFDMLYQNDCWAAIPDLIMNDQCTIWKKNKYAVIHW